MTNEEFKKVCEAHENESWWYLFLNYGCPIEDPEFTKKFEAVAKALKEYVEFLDKQKEILNPQDCELNL